VYVKDSLLGNTVAGLATAAGKDAIGW